MKGLLLKDFYTIWKAGRIFIILYIFIAAVSGMNLQNGWSYMGFWMVMMDAQTLSTFSYDHSCNWNRFALTMPVTRKDVVQSKFLLQLLIVFGSMLAYLVLAALVSLVLRTFEVKAFCNMPSCLRRFPQCCCRRRLPYPYCPWWSPDCAISSAAVSFRRKI